MQTQSSSWTVRKDINNEFEKKKVETIEKLSKVEHLTCTNDAGSSFGAKSFIDVNVHYVTEDFKLKKKVLDVMEMKIAKTAENYRANVDEKLAEFNILEKTFVFTTDNENTMRAAFKDEEINGCFAHIESIASKKALDGQKPLKSMRFKLKKISKKVKKACKFKYALERPKVKANIEAVNQAMIDAKFKKAEIAKLKIKDPDVKKMKELVKVLDMLEEGITLIGAEKYCTGSVILPFLSKFLKILDDNSVVVGSFKTMLKTELEERCELNLNNSVLAKASLFDKRFSHLKKDERDLILEEVKKELKEIEKKPLTATKEKESSTEEPPKKKKRFLGHGLDFSDDDLDERELESYLSEKKLKGDGDPLLWWNLHKEEYPNLARLARKYLAVQGTATPAERIMSRLGEILSKRRLAMKGDLFSKIMFLTDCY